MDITMNFSFMRGSVFQYSLFVLASVGFLSCGPSKSGNVTEAEAPGEAATASEAALTYKVDADNSYATWIGSKAIGKHNGTIALSEGVIRVEGADITSGRVVFGMSSLRVLDIPLEDEDNEKLKGHLLSADFFDAANHPDMVFELISVSSFDANAFADKEEFASDYSPETSSAHRVESPTHNLTGNLTIRGVTKGITFPARVEMDGDNLRASAKFNIDRTDWSVSYGDESSVVDKLKDKFVYNTVNVGFELAAAKEQE